MSQPIWNTSTGLIGTFIENIAVSYQFSASPGTVGNTLTYEILSGNFPTTTDINQPFKLSSAGLLTGIPTEVSVLETYEFSIRVKEYDGYALVGLSDRSFSIIISGPTIPVFTIPGGSLLTTNDYTWVSLQLSYTNLDPTNNVEITLINGSLPAGLELSISGLITGYCLPPTNVITGAPENKTYEFTVQIDSQSGTSTATYTITVNNQELIPGFVGRKPTILNNRPLSTYIDEFDQYKGYYFSGQSIGSFDEDNNFYFKFIGKDFEEQDLIYEFQWVGSSIGTIQFNTIEGWMHGSLPLVSGNNVTYTLNVRTKRKNNVSITSDWITYTITIIGDVNYVINWLTDYDLGYIDNGQVSTKFVLAESAGGYDLTYVITGSLPPNLVFESTGEIRGKLVFESKNIRQELNEETIYLFEVEAYYALNPLVTSTKQFKLTTRQKHVIPYENVFMRPMLSIEKRTIIKDFLTNSTIFPSSSLYRPTDPYFGVVSALKYFHVFGITVNTSSDYLSILNRNHYVRDITLGEIKYAIAKNENNQIIYEVVYCEVVDYFQEKDTKTSIRNEFVWPRLINGSALTVYPNSLTNMRDRLTITLGAVNNTSVLPLWMTSQQANGTSLGYVPAVVICYAKPGYGSVIKNNIETLWQYKLNEFQFKIDRYEIDKTMTYQYVKSTDTWSQLPSSVSLNDNQNLMIYISKKNIIQ